MTIRTQLRAGGWSSNHNEALRVRSTVKAGGGWANHNESLKVRTALKAGGRDLQHNDALRVRSTVKAGAVRRMIGLRRQMKTSANRNDRLTLLVVRTGLLAGRAAVRGRI
jgi:hypothetical protein